MNQAFILAALHVIRKPIPLSLNLTFFSFALYLKEIISILLLPTSLRFLCWGWGTLYRLGLLRRLLDRDLDWLDNLWFWSRSTIRDKSMLFIFKHRLNKHTSLITIKSNHSLQNKHTVWFNTYGFSGGKNSAINCLRFSSLSLTISICSSVCFFCSFISNYVNKKHSNLENFMYLHTEHNSINLLSTNLFTYCCQFF